MDKTMANNLMYIPNDDKTKFFLMQITINDETNENLVKVGKVVKPMNMRMLSYKFNVDVDQIVTNCLIPLDP